MNRQQRRQAARRARKKKGGGGPSGGGPRDDVATQLAAARTAHMAGGAADAEAIYDRVLAIEPDNADALHLKGLAVFQQGRSAPAAELIARAAALAPKAPGPQGNLGNVLMHLGRYDEAEAALGRALTLDPAYRQGYHNLGALQLARARYGAAAEAFRKVLEIDPGNLDAISNLGVALRQLGRNDEAIERFREVLARDPANDRAHSNLIFALDFDPETDTAQQQAERGRWAAQHATGFASASHENDPDPDRPLRIGYISSDFREHSAAHGFAPVILARDRERFHATCYAVSRHRDAMTARLEASADIWRPVVGVSDEDLAKRIRGDRIDILVDLSGHTAGNRLLVMARRPAPVQATGWGHVTGTGLPMIDYLFADDVLIPPAEAALFAEDILPLPCFLSYVPGKDEPAVTAPPVLAHGTPTFGAFNRLEKAGDDVIDLWAELLKACPEGRLLFKDRAFDDDARADEVRAGFAERGVSSDRLDFLGGSDRGAHLAAYAKVDIALDPFPHGGGITTLETLWMGVPVVALLGKAPASPHAASILNATGQADLVAADAADYVRLARDLARDTDRLAALREDLRPRLADSALGDPKRYAAAVEAHYREIWRTWCARQ